MKKIIISVLIALMCLTISNTSNATAKDTTTTESKTKETKCHSKHDTNSYPYCGFDFMNAKDLNKAYKKHQIWVPAIQVIQKKKKVTIKYQNATKASGYQIRYSKKMKKNKLVNPNYVITKGLKKVIKTKNSKITYIQIRPYKIIKNKKIYGRWSSIYSYS